LGAGAVSRKSGATSVGRRTRANKAEDGKKPDDDDDPRACAREIRRSGLHRHGRL